MKNLIVAVVITALVAGGSAFYGGMQYQKSQNSNANQNRFAQMTGVGGPGQRGAVGRNIAGGGLVSGEVISKDSQSITLKLRDGGSKIVFFSTSTQFMKFATGTLLDIATGESLVVTGTSNSDGSVTAQSIQTRPQGAGQFGPGSASSTQN
ncbi:MAG: hypothetical protein NTV62_03565 [Candidatus Gribaldobacteria bacterium]|nr:hypothetical protein [Candidatus Gribaldobacteria bacterium]